MILVREGARVFVEVAVAIVYTCPTPLSSYRQAIFHVVVDRRDGGRVHGDRPSLFVRVEEALHIKSLWLFYGDSIFDAIDPMARLSSTLLSRVTRRFEGIESNQASSILWIDFTYISSQYGDSDACMGMVCVSWSLGCVMKLTGLVDTTMFVPYGAN